MLALSRRLAILTLFNLPTVPDIATAATSYPFGSVQPSNILLLKLPMPPSRCLRSTDVYPPYRNILVASSTISVWWSMVYFWSGVSVHSHLPCAARTRLLAPAAAAALLPPRRRLIGVSFFTWNAAGSHRRRAHSVNSPCSSAVAALFPHACLEARLSFPTSLGNKGPRARHRSLGNCAFVHLDEICMSAAAIQSHTACSATAGSPTRAPMIVDATSHGVILGAFYYHCRRVRLSRDVAPI